MIERGIFKANDIRGVVGTEWDAEGARAIGAAWADTIDLGPGSALVCARDMRLSGPELSAAFIDGITGRGVDVVDIGLASTDELWFASGHLDLPGVMFTASHNPGEYNGIKFCFARARPVTAALLTELADRALAGPPPASGPRGTVTEQDLLPAYAAYLHGLVDLNGIRRLRIVADAGNGMAGHTLPSVLGVLDVDLIGLYTEPDGSFPHHPPNPLDPANLVDAQRAVREHGADIGLVFDGDADRCFIIDERGEVVTPSAVTALIAIEELAHEPGATIVCNVVTSRAVAEIVAEHGGQLVRTRVGHTFVKQAMAEHGAIFGGEHSAHYYFRDFWSADTGLLAALHVLARLGRQPLPLSALAAGLTRYAASGELNSRVADAEGATRRVAEAYAGRGDLDWSDGLRIDADEWWISLRSSNTEPLLRLNVEARDTATMARLRDDVLSIIRTDQETT